MNEEKELVKELFNGYEPDVKPSVHSNTPINVSLTFYLNRIKSLVSFWELHVSSFGPFRSILLYNTTRLYLNFKCEDQNSLTIFTEWENSSPEQLWNCWYGECFHLMKERFIDEFMSLWFRNFEFWFTKAIKYI